MMRSISWCEMSILNESSISLPKFSASTFARSFLSATMASVRAAAAWAAARAAEVTTSETRDE